MDDLVERIETRLEKAGEEIARALEGTGRDAGSVRIMAATKTRSVEEVRAVVDAGIRIIGENRVTEGGRKIRQLDCPDCEFHVIGPLHRKEVRQAFRDFDSIDSVDRVVILSEIARRVRMKKAPQPGILIEVNTSGESSKSGFEPDRGVLEEALGTADELGLKVNGFLTIGPLGGEESETREAFCLLRELRDWLVKSLGKRFPELSMGMSEDFTWAVAEGATTVRLGRYLLGPRNG
ncbi:YggS family pyridoxal phosphate-dependent enzyme [Candidatus Fermentibacteria bacterium]|nr:YggS family pyridoxal phosphate-dependent enzyme [Candidatus Fermentibacteria bacterium]